MGDLSDFRIGQIVGANLAGASINKTATLLGLSRAMVSKHQTQIMRRLHQLRGTVIETQTSVQGIAVH
jgi:predicted transcriptional regulator